MSEHVGLPSLEDLYAKASTLAGRPVEVDRLSNGQYIVLWMRFDCSPPSASMSEAGALEKFIQMMEAKSGETLPELTPEDIQQLNVEQRQQY